MKYKEITVNTTTEASELVADILFERGSNGVGIYDKNDFAALVKSDVIWDYVDESVLNQSEVVKVKGFFAEQGFADTLALVEEDLRELAQRSCFATGSLEITVGEVDDEDWVNVWKKHYRPIPCGRIVVVPNWLAYQAKEGEQIVKMDPGMAFGTGEHETTRICLNLLQKDSLENKRVADIGTGSGILAIAAAKLGAESVDAFDIDDIAVKAARNNCEFNGVSNLVNVDNADLLAKCNGVYDVVLANITADILIALCNDLSRYVKKGGTVIISGIIHKRDNDVRSAFENHGLVVKEKITDGEWCGYSFERI